MPRPVTETAPIGVDDLPLGVRVKRLVVAGAFVLSGGVYAFDLTAQMSQTRTISIRNIHNTDVVTVEYKRNGRYVPEAMERINWVMRDWRRNEIIKMEPALIDLLWEIHNELGSRQPINLICGYRSRGTNEMLRRTVGGQASESRHILGKAADVQFPDVPLKQMRYSAMVRERGGVGYYPTSATPFIHVDIDRVRAWPRMPRFELALLFPNGRTKHKPADGGELTSDDVRTARARQPDVAVQLAAFHDMRRKGSNNQPSVIAALAPGAADIVFTPGPKAIPRAAPKVTPVAVPQSPKLVIEPHLADRPLRLTARPSDDDRRKLSQLVALAGIPELVAPPALVVRPQPAVQEPKRKGPDVKAEAEATGSSDGGVLSRLTFLSALGVEALKGWSSGFTIAPAWDDDHPEEAAYRPFPIAPFLTETASTDDPALDKLVHPDLAKTGDLFDVSEAAGAMRLRPGPHVAQLMWSQEATGNAIDIAQLSPASASAASSRLVAVRRVQP